jgi:uncharacterized protein
VTYHDEMVYVARARDFGARALAMAFGRTHDEFVAEDLRYVPVLHSLQRMSDAAARTSESFRAEHGAVPWSEIVAISEQVAPGFFADDPEATWRIATGPLDDYVAALVAIVPPDLGQEQADAEAEMPAAGEATPRRGLRLSVPHDRLAELCRRYRVRRLRFFGSVLRDDFGPESDVDVLVDFEVGVDIGMEFFDLQEELSELLGGREVDLVKSDLLDKYVRNRVLRGAEDVYAA